MTSVIRGILMKTIYGRTYQTVDQNMSDAQIRARIEKKCWKPFICPESNCEYCHVI